MVPRWKCSKTQPTQTNKRGNWFRSCKAGAESLESAARMAPCARSHWVTITTTTIPVGWEVGPSLGCSIEHRYSWCFTKCSIRIMRRCKRKKEIIGPGSLGINTKKSNHIMTILKLAAWVLLHSTHTSRRPKRSQTELNGCFLDTQTCDFMNKWHL